MAGADRKLLLLKAVFEANRRRRRMSLSRIVCAIQQRRQKLVACVLALLLLVSNGNETTRSARSCRRLPRNTGWWQTVWSTYSDQRFKKTFRVSRKTFLFILSKIHSKLVKQPVAEEPVSPECRLALCLYRLGRGDYFYTIAEMAGLGPSTVSTIVEDVSKSIISCMWKDTVDSLMPNSVDSFREKIVDMGELWQHPYAWAAVDGCHIPIKCPPGGQQSAKEYHNFKNFYSVVLMALVDARYRFVWGSCGFPGNSHDAVISKSTKLWESLTDGSLLPNFKQKLGDVLVPPLILGDSAFPLETFLMKPYTSAVLSDKQHYHNYRLSRARMVVEGAFGQLKGRWRVLLRKSEGGHFQAKLSTLACMILHNVCIEMKDAFSSQLDLGIDPATKQRRDRKSVRELLLMSSIEKPLVEQNNSKQAQKIRNEIADKFWQEKIMA